MECDMLLDLIVTIATSLAVFVAIYASNKYYFHGWVFKPGLDVGTEVLTIEQNRVIVSRLKIINTGKAIAKNVEFVVDKLEYKDGQAWKISDNFISFPLNWTHQDKINQDLYKQRPYYLDLCEVVASGPYIRLTSPVGHPGKHGIDDLKKGGNRVRIVAYGDNLKSKSFSAEIQWSGNFSNAEGLVSDDEKPHIKIKELKNE